MAARECASSRQRGYYLRRMVLSAWPTVVLVPPAAAFSVLGVVPTAMRSSRGIAQEIEPLGSLEAQWGM